MLKTFIWMTVIFIGVAIFGTILGLGIAADPDYAPDPARIRGFFAIAGILYGIVTLITMSAAYREKRIWNNGVCRKTGLPWRRFDQDSQGGRGYTTGETTCWISYPVDR